ncbi:sortase [candidate division WWE3 bacterium]|nr:sortase [candidate division WWE3 bacterium]
MVEIQSYKSEQSGRDVVVLEEIVRVNEPVIKRKKNRSKKINPAALVPLVAVLIFLITISEGALNSKEILLAESVVVPYNILYQTSEDIPTRILIPKVSTDLAVKPAEIKDGTWQTFDDFASFGIGSSALNISKGSTVIFAHAKLGLFARLDELDYGDFIYVLSNRNWFRYSVHQKLYVYPDEVEFLKQDYGRSLILFTCYGPADEKRVVVIAKFIGGEDGI